ncbi:MAG: hypothetical protein AAFR47_17210 [Pseudomonadota bacterium]
MGEIDLPSANAELAHMLRERLGVRRGTSLEAKLHHAGRAVPKHLRHAGARLAEAERLWANPRLRRQLDLGALAGAEAELRGWLDGIDAADRRRGILLGILAGLAFNFMLIATGVIVYLAYIDWL